MMKDLKVAFFGTSDRSLAILQALNQNFNLVLCVTKSDSKVGRKHEVRETEVKKWSRQNSIKYFELSSIKDQKEELQSLIKKYQIDLGVVADFSFIIPESVINTFPHGMINIHFSLLPKLRGASPVQSVILLDLKSTGVTYYLMDKGMDTGDIIFQFEHSIDPDLTSQDLYLEMFNKAGAQLPSVIQGYLNKILIPKIQDHKEATYSYSPTHPKNTFIYKEDAQIKLNDKRHSFRAIKAYNPWPMAWVTFKDIAKEQNIELKDKSKENLKIKLINAIWENDTVKITEVIPEGYKKMTWEQLLSGFFEKKKN